MKISFLFFIVFISFFLTPISAQNKYNYAKNRACYQSSAFNYNQTAHLTTDGYISTSWRSKTHENEWIYVDLGKVYTLSSIAITFDSLYATEFKILVSTKIEGHNPINWREVFSTAHGRIGLNDINFEKTGAQFVKFQGIASANNGGFSINEFQVFGNKKPVSLSVMPEPPVKANGTKYLSGGNWKLQRAAFVSAKSETLSSPGFDDSDWIPATVPGTVLVSYLNIGAIPDPNYADQQLMISEAFFTADFWYRNTFLVPKSYSNNLVWLNFDGINYKADVFFNGNFIGKIEGAFIKSKFDVTAYVKAGQENALAVLVYPNENPGEVTEQHLNDPDGNGGIIGFDGPTFLSSIGWNWMPTIRGRNAGIWNDVFLSTSKSLTLSEPLITTDFNLPDTTKAYLSIMAKVTNNSNAVYKGLFKGSFSNISFQDSVELQPNESKLVQLNYKQFPQLVVNNPKLWWPNGYGQPNLYTLNLNVEEAGITSHAIEVEFGMRKYTYSYDNNKLRIHINGYPLIIRGGNWGMAESMLRCDKAGYDLRVRLHKEMNLNMIRNWIGMVGDDEFYEACDKYGIMVWDDFWLANPVDGPTPKNIDLFMDNARSKIMQRRNNACVAIWVGRNEGFPPADIDSCLQNAVNELDETRHYISSSAHNPVSGLGPYEIMNPKWYFTNRGTTFHSEQGIVAFPSIESFKQMMPADKLWPVNDMWGKHDWTQPRVKIYNDEMHAQYGEPTSIEEFCQKAQFMNMEGPKAMMETWQCNRGSGVIVWMTHSAWPSLICQTYDYYFEPTAAYFAIKKGSRLIHILWNAGNEKVYVANNTLKPLQNLTAQVLVFDLNGKQIHNESFAVNVNVNTAEEFVNVPYPEGVTRVHFIKLSLFDENKNLVADNFYWRSTQYQNYTDLSSMAKVKLEGEASISKNIGKAFVSVTLKNNTEQVALMARLKAVKSKSEERILPVFYEDNYFSLVPGESKKVSIEFLESDLKGESEMLLLEGWNIETIKIPITLIKN